jgi:Spy/CpxP family protein refolding chaperone
MKHIASLATLALVLSGGMALAQQPAPAPATPPATPDAAMTPAPTVKPMHPHKEVEKLSKQLNLTPDQTAKLMPIFKDRDEKITAIKSNTALSPEDAKKQVHGVMKSTQDQIKAILTPDQLATMKSLHEEHKSHGQPEAAAPSTPPSA